jgi:hypothetical protein
VLPAAGLPPLAGPGGGVTAPLADPGLLERFRAAGSKVQWRLAVGPQRGRIRAGPGRSVRIAHLHDEEARVESQEAPGGFTMRTDSGPVGALVIVLEMDRRGEPTRLTTHPAGAVPGFDMGALEAVWSPGRPPQSGGLPVADLVGLARYALA